MLLVMSRMCQFTAVALCAPLLVGLHYHEAVWRHYGTVALTALSVSVLLRLLGPHDAPATLKITRREGFAAVVLSWMTLVFFGALPFWLSGSMATLADAVFESASGFSTTGATILTDIEALPHAHLFQRSLSHWIGGMGIIVLSVAILPELAVGGMQLFSAESSGIDTDKLSPRIVSTARRLWQVYVAMTVVLVVLLLFGHMNFFDAVTHAFGTVATGGFSTHNASIAAFDSLYIESVTVIFMLAAGISFALLFRFIIRRQPGPLLRSEEVRMYLGIFVLFALAITVNLLLTGTYPDMFSAARAAIFQTATIITTTGFGTANFDAWPDFSRYLLVLLMVMGGCAGSTAGGIKAIRLLLVYRHAIVELKKLIHPSLVQPVTVARRGVRDSTLQGILGFLLLYIITTAVATGLVLATGVDLITGTTAVIAAMNSIGPGLGLVGPASNYAALPESCKWILSACMLVGRLEIYTVFVLFTPGFWRR